MSAVITAIRMTLLGLWILTLAIAAAFRYLVFTKLPAALRGAPVQEAAALQE